MFNPALLMKLKSARDTFVRNHPKFPMFLTKVKDTAIEEGTIIDITVTKVNGETITSNIKLKPEDIELFSGLAELVKQS